MYLQETYSGVPADHLIPIWIKKNGATEFYSIAEIEKAEQRLIELSKQGDAYFGWCPLKHQPASGRGASKDVGSSPGIMFDADLFNPAAHSQTALPHTLADVMGWLDDAGIFRPTEIRSSGNGLYLDWLHDDPVVFGTDAERERYAKSVKEIHAALRKSALELRGWRFDNTGDLARLTRMPGTLNHKTNPPKPVEVIDV